MANISVEASPLALQSLVRRQPWSLSAPSAAELPAAPCTQVSHRLGRTRCRGDPSGRFVFRPSLVSAADAFPLRRAGGPPWRRTIPRRAGACRRPAAPPRLPPARAVSSICFHDLTQRSMCSRSTATSARLTPLQTVPPAGRLPGEPWRPTASTPTRFSTAERRSSTLAAFAVDRPAAPPPPLGHTRCRRQPRGFRITDSGRFLNRRRPAPHRVGCTASTHSARWSSCTITRSARTELGQAFRSALNPAYLRRWAPITGFQRFLLPR